MELFDVIILGGGTGGYVAAIRASQLGLRVAVVEKGKLGGTCLHAGCIPSKALLRSAEVYHTLQQADKFGVSAGEVTFEFENIMARKQRIVDQLHNGVQFLMKKGAIAVFDGFGRIKKSSPMVEVTVEKNDGSDLETLSAKKLIIATGSRPRSLPGLTIDGKYLLTSDEALQLTQLPQSMLIVGGGVIGIEWASLLSDFGVEVTILEYADRIIPTEDEDVSKEMLRSMKKRKVKVVTGAKVLADTVRLDTDRVSISAEVKGTMQTFSAQQILISIGRLANTDGFGLADTKVQVENGVIMTNEMMQTADENIYAIGDVIGGLQLAHVASHEGIIAVEHIAGHKPNPLEHRLVPKCIYSRPEAANVGLTETEAINNGYEVKTGKFHFKTIGKALVYGESDGFVKFVSDAKTDKLLGVHMIGPHVTDMISEAGLALLLEASSYQVGQLIHPHPSLSEAIGEAALAVDGLSING